MEQAPTVSVVIPTFNRTLATRRAVQSVLAQSVAPLEIVIVDDGSAEPFAAAADWPSAPEIRILRLAANRGAAAARAAGVDAARGEVIAFLDSDDAWTPGKLAAQLAVLVAEGRRSDAALTAVVCGWQAVPESGRAPTVRIPVASASVLDFASGCWFSPGTTALVPRRAFARVGPFDAALRRLEDLDWFLRLGLAGGRIAVAPIVGATVSIGRRGRLRDIDAAAAIILDKINRLEDKVLARALTRRLTAYLDVERANAALGERQLVATAAYLTRSLVKRPRLTIPLKAWWLTRTDDGRP